MLDANKAVVRKFVQALGAGDADTLKSLITPDIEAVCTGTCLLSATRGFDEIVGAAGMLKQVTQAGIAFEILQLTAEGDRVAAEIQGRSTLVTGVDYNNEYHFLFFLRDGRIYRMKEYMDTLLTQTVFAPLLAKSA